MIPQLTLATGVWFLGRDGTRRKMRYEKVSTPTLSWFREHSPADKLAWSTDGRTEDGNEAARLVMRDHCQYDAYGPIPATVDTPDKLVVTLLLRCEIDKRTNVITEGIVGGPGMDTETLVRHAYRINGKTEPDAEGLAWWVHEVNTGKWRNFVDCLLGISAVFADAGRR